MILSDHEKKLSAVLLFHIRSYFSILKNIYTLYTYYIYSL